jgi:tetratricopeptide (TPR) repeat protein
MDDLHAKASAMQERGEWGAPALTVYDAILAANPDDEAATVGRARCLRALGRLEESLAALEALSRARPENGVARSQAAKTRRRLRAKERAEQLLADDPAKLFDALERAKREEHKYDFQIEGRRLLARRDRTSKAACALGAAQRRGRDLEGALNTYRWAWQQDDSPTSNAIAHVGLAAVLRDVGQLSDAERILRGVRDADRRNHYAGITLAAVLMDRVENQGHREKLAEAKQLLDAAWVAGTRGVVIDAAYGRLRSLE